MPKLITGADRLESDQHVYLSLVRALPAVKTEPAQSLAVPGGSGQEGCTPSIHYRSARMSGRLLGVGSSPRRVCFRASIKPDSRIPWRTAIFVIQYMAHATSASPIASATMASRAKVCICLFSSNKFIGGPLLGSQS